MAEPAIRIDITRLANKDTTRIDGQSALVVCSPKRPGPVIDHTTQPPFLAVRCDTQLELAWNLAAMMAAVKAIHPEAFIAATGLMSSFGFDNVGTR